MAFTLYGPNNRATAFKTGNAQSRRLISQGYGLRAGSYRAPGKQGSVNPPPPVSAPGFDYAALAREFAGAVAPTQAPRPTFESSGLYNEADAQAQAGAEFNPYFQEQGADLEKQFGRKRDDSAFAQQQYGADLQRRQAAMARQFQGDTGNQQADYLNRGLSRSGAFQGAQTDLAQQQTAQRAGFQEADAAQQRAFTLGGQDLTDEQTRQQKALEQKKKGALEDYRTRAYNLAYQKYLGQFQ
jgi:hypothetical protein